MSEQQPPAWADPDDQHDLEQVHDRHWDNRPSRHHDADVTHDPALLAAVAARHAGAHALAEYETHCDGTPAGPTPAPPSA